MKSLVPAVASAVAAYMARPSMSSTTRTKSYAPRYVGAPIRKRKWAYKSKKLSVADKALKTSPSKFIIQENSSRFSAPLGRQAFRTVNTNLDDSQFSQIMLAEGKVFDSDYIYKMYISSCKNMVTVRNATNVQAILYMYHVAPKHRQTTDFLTDLDIGDDQLHTEDTLANQVSFDNVSTNPFDFPKIYQNWYKLKTEKIVLQAGEVRTFDIFRPIKKSFSTANLNLSQPTTTPGQFFPGMSSQIIFRVHGTPVNDSNAEGSISTSTARVEFVTSTKIWYKIVDGGAPTSQAVNKLISSFSGDQDVMLEATDTKTTVTAS